MFFCTCCFNVLLGLGCWHYWAVVKDAFYAGFLFGLIHTQYLFQQLLAHEDYHPMPTFVLVSLTHANNRPAPLFSSMKCVKGFFLEGGVYLLS